MKELLFVFWFWLGLGLLTILGVILKRRIDALTRGLGALAQRLDGIEKKRAAVQPQHDAVKNFKIL